MLTIKRLNEMLSYDPLNGEFRWRDRTKLRYTGLIAGSLDKNGYRRISIDSKSYRAARLAWLYMTGRWPKNEIDHKNGIRSDDRFSNLREATRFQNNANSRTPITNTSGFKGVTVYPRNPSRWQARIWTNGTVKYLGNFATKEEAHRAFHEEAKRLRGDFTRT